MNIVKIYTFTASTCSRFFDWLNLDFFICIVCWSHATIFLPVFFVQNIQYNIKKSIKFIYICVSYWVICLFLALFKKYKSSYILLDTFSSLDFICQLLRCQYGVLADVKIYYNSIIIARVRSCHFTFQNLDLDWWLTKKIFKRFVVTVANKNCPWSIDSMWNNMIHCIHTYTDYMLKFWFYITHKSVDLKAG